MVEVLKQLFELLGALYVRKAYVLEYLPQNPVTEIEHEQSSKRSSQA